MGSSAPPTHGRAARSLPDTERILDQDARRRGAISRPSSRRALFAREPSPGIRIGLASLRGRKIAAARHAPPDSRAGSRNSSRTMPAVLIGIEFLPVLNRSVRELERAKGFEPSTPTLARLCSTPELHPHPPGGRYCS